jgi:DNA-directed RNA polymerase subunit RPC12/RpoP
MATTTSSVRAETAERRCPHCFSVTIVMAYGRILADRTGMRRIEYRCQACGTPFCLIQPLPSIGTT